jgi:hypothetical protein
MNAPNTSAAALVARLMAEYDALERRHTELESRYAGLADAAQAVCDGVSRDDSGTKAGGWRDGNGGLLSRDTIIANDRLRRALARVKPAGSIGG